MILRTGRGFRRGSAPSPATTASAASGGGGGADAPPAGDTGAVHRPGHDHVPDRPAAAHQQIHRLPLPAPHVPAAAPLPGIQPLTERKGRGAPTRPDFAQSTCAAGHFPLYCRCGYTVPQYYAVSGGMKAEKTNRHASCAGSGAGGGLRPVARWQRLRKRLPDAPLRGKRPAPLHHDL